MTGEKLADAAKELFFRAAASGVVPARLFQPAVPPVEARTARTGELTIEIVSHCWKYQHLLAYQLSSLVLYPPTRVSVRMTVFFSPEDEGTAALLRFFGARQVPGVSWNWRPLERTHLMRRAIGRNIAARETRADWIWFTDCDVVFDQGSLDSLIAQLQGRRDALVHPREEHCTPLLAEQDPMLTAAADEPRIVEINRERFTPRSCSVAKGPMQITHGDVARACGYCDSLSVYQTPSDRWRKAYEDRAFRWLLRTQGVGLDIPGVYRIRHASKGRYRKDRPSARLRGGVRRFESWLRERWNGVRTRPH